MRRLTEMSAATDRVASRPPDWLPSGDGSVTPRISGRSAVAKGPPPSCAHGDARDTAGTRAEARPRCRWPAHRRTGRGTASRLGQPGSAGGRAEAVAVGRLTAGALEKGRRRFVRGSCRDCIDAGPGADGGPASGGRPDPRQGPPGVARQVSVPALAGVAGRCGGPAPSAGRRSIVGPAAQDWRPAGRHRG